MKKMILGLLTMAALMTACQSNSYKVNGIAEGFADGDTIYLSEDLGAEPSQTVIVKDGRFSFEGEADSVRLHGISAPKYYCGTLFFTEPGTINVTLSTDKPAVVGGTRSNEGWQELNNLQNEFSKNTDSLLEQIYSQELDEEH